MCKEHFTPTCKCAIKNFNFCFKYHGCLKTLDIQQFDFLLESVKDPNIIGTNIYKTKHILVIYGHI